jgi:YVTN family beta-propeller protein
VAVTADGAHAFVANVGTTLGDADVVSAIDTSTNKLVTRVFVEKDPRKVAVADRTLYVTNWRPSVVTIADL